MADRLYEIELWDMAGQRIADISHLAKNRKYTLQRNEAEELGFSLDLEAWENYCDNVVKTDPVNLMNPLQTHIRVKRGGQYLFGCQVVDQTLDAGADSQTISVTCKGFLDLFKDRYIAKTYSQVEATAIAWGLLDTTQSQTNGSVGVTLGGQQFTTGVLRDRTYERDNVKLMLQNLTALRDGNFDFKFTYDKKFETYELLGGLRSDISLVFGDGGNVKHLYYPKNGLSTYNLIYGLGSGFGPDQLSSTKIDDPSQRAYYIREAIKQYNSVTVQATLDQNTQAAVDMYKELLKIPQVTITGNELAGKPFLGVGDRVPVKAEGHSYLNDVNGLYRIERMSVTIDDNDFESDISLYFDDYRVDQNEL